MVVEAVEGGGAVLLTQNRVRGLDARDDGRLGHLPLAHRQALLAVRVGQLEELPLVLLETADDLGCGCVVPCVAAESGSDTGGVQAAEEPVCYEGFDFVREDEGSSASAAAGVSWADVAPATVFARTRNHDM